MNLVTHKPKLKPVVWLFLAGATAVALTFLGTTSHSAPDLNKLKSKLDKLKIEITKLNDDLHCRKDTDCDFVELGAKPCGGPREHLIYSKKNPKASAVKRKAADYSALEKQINGLEQLVSECSALLPPDVKCMKKTCVNAAADAGTGAATERPQ
jgi:hypothetical protein